MMKKYAICDDCKEPIKNIFDIHDYVDINMQEHCVCGKCLNKWIALVGNDFAKKLVLKTRMDAHIFKSKESKIEFPEYDIISTPKDKEAFHVYGIYNNELVYVSTILPRIKYKLMPKEWYDKCNPIRKSDKTDMLGMFFTGCEIEEYLSKPKNLIENKE